LRKLLRVGADFATVLEEEAISMDTKMLNSKLEHVKIRQCYEIEFKKSRLYSGLQQVSPVLALIFPVFPRAKIKMFINFNLWMSYAITKSQYSDAILFNHLNQGLELRLRRNNGVELDCDILIILSGHV
jgi:hypothetical protein